ncbi:hypothetical protein VE03_09217 [Pseudogymnoascus sp. 23342-1-I1]|nr:hypothetical protein VE03_09217 [Pseudogymnoascus sp. 23342-1-I1]
MHQASASSTGLDFLPPSRNIYNPHYPSTYTQTGWPRSLLPPTNAPIHRYATPDSTSRSTGLGPSVADRERWLQYASNIPAISTRGRLPTPPADDMSVHQPQQSTTSNGVRQGITFPSIASYQTSASALAYPYNFASRAAETLRLGSTASSTSQLYDDRSHNGVTNAVEERVQEVVPRKESIHSSAQITPPLNGGSIGELAAQLTCLFWFETTETLRKAENWTPSSSPVERIAPDAIPTATFRKWVLTILSTTQVTPNVILLALMFIYRLKTLNPTVKGKAGSEYRLLTVALMLGNKFLDDNTYTNKTWAEVSGISVVEIHVMEVEFLGSMRYSLLASKEQWAEWQIKLGKFGDYFERASKLPLPLPSPVSNTFPSSKLPSPTRVQSHSPISSSHLSNSSFELNQQWPSQYTSSQPLPQPPQATKKRAFDDLWVEPPSKRPATISAAHIPAVLVPNSQITAPRQQAPRLPVPQLSISTSSGAGYPTFAQTLPPLPPLNGRAMSQVFPATPSWAPNPQINVPSSVMPPQTQQPYSLPGSNHGTPSRRHSPRSIGVHSMNSSPISGIFPSAVHDLNSPSIFLQQRNSPYKPIRLPNTLLYPPPQSSYQHFQPGIDQMHYQPLGKRNDYRSGVVPEYAANPIYQHYPSLPQPTFHPLA